MQIVLELYHNGEWIDTKHRIDQQDELHARAQATEIWAYLYRREKTLRLRNTATGEIHEIEADVYTAGLVCPTGIEVTTTRSDE